MRTPPATKPAGEGSPPRMTDHREAPSSLSTRYFVATYGSEPLYQTVFRSLSRWADENGLLRT